jgi:hypothetical protein
VVASEERNALLYSSPVPEDDYEAAPPDTGISPATRKLATVLGRFERHVARAREGAPQEMWSDECMNQLIRAVEIAVAEGWPEVVEALTETGRILQSYENEGQAHLSVRFLTESYEILSQMVSDLMLGKARSGLMQKWRNRYRMALQDLKDAGIILVRDEEDPYAAPRIAERAQSRERRFDRELRPEPVAVERSAPFEMPAETPRSSFGSYERVDSPSMDDYFHGEADENPTDEATMDAEAGSEAPWDEPAPVADWEEVTPERDVEARVPVEVEEIEAEEEEDTTGLLGELPPLAPLGGDLLELGPEEEIESERLEDDRSGAGGTAPEVIERLDVLCERLSHMEREPEADLAEGFLVILDSVAFLELQADFYNRPSCVELCQAMTRMCAAAAERETLPQDNFFELAYAFCGVYVEAEEGPENAMIRGWIAECDTLLTEWTPSESETEDVIVESGPEVEVEEEEAVFTDEIGTEAPETDELFFEEELVESEAEADVDVEEIEAELESALEPVAKTEEPPRDADDFLGADSPEALLHVAQRAMTEGNASVAKRLALQAASMLAQIEVEDANRRVNEAERRLQEGAELIEAARGDVQRAELVVDDTARSVADGQKVLDTRRAEVTGMSQKLVEVEARVADLDEQIRQLQLRRAEEAARLDETRGELLNTQQREAETEADITARNEAEREARMRLEDARQRVKNLQRKRSEIESAMDRARETLTQQRVSLADIQQMLAQVGAQAAPQQAAESDSGEFLF